MSVEVNARIGVRGRLYVGLGNEVRELLIGERMRSPAGEDDLAVLDVNLAAVAELPAVEVLSVEERNPAVLVGSGFRRVIAGRVVSAQGGGGGEQQTASNGDDKS